MQLTDMLGWSANIGFVVGSFLIARKKISGFYWFGLANAIYMVIGIMLNTTSLSAISVYLFAMNIYGIIHWRKNKR